MIKQPAYLFECLTCGRPIEIDMKWLGQKMACGHCRRIFVAYDPLDLQTRTPFDRSDIEREDQFLCIGNHVNFASQLLILIEHRDDVYAHLAANMNKVGMDVIRAGSVEEVLRLILKYRSPLVVTNRDFPSQSGWALLDKLNTYAPQIEAWIYMPYASNYVDVLAQILEVNEVLVYEHNLGSLTNSFTQLLTDRQNSINTR